jgi:hypothetical protein
MEIKDFLKYLGLSVEEFAGIALLRHPELIAKRRGKRKLFIRCLAALMVEAMLLGGKIAVADDGNLVLLKIGKFNHNPALLRYWLNL